MVMIEWVCQLPEKITFTAYILGINKTNLNARNHVHISRSGSRWCRNEKPVRVVQPLQLHGSFRYFCFHAEFSEVGHAVMPLEEPARYKDKGSDARSYKKNLDARYTLARSRTPLSREVQSQNEKMLRAYESDVLPGPYEAQTAKQYKVKTNKGADSVFCVLNAEKLSGQSS